MTSMGVMPMVRELIAAGQRRKLGQLLATACEAQEGAAQTVIKFWHEYQRSKFARKHLRRLVQR